MKKNYCILFLLQWIMTVCLAQDLPPITEQQLENLADVEQAEPEDDSYLQVLDQFRNHPLNINTADAAELKELRILTDLQIDHLLSYRKFFGPLIHIYELQAVPAWDVVTIRKLLGFITAGPLISVRETIRLRLRGGEHSLLLRIAQVLEKSKGFDQASAGSKYLGSPHKIFLRHRYMYKNLLQYGIVGDKDAGEQFFKGAQNKGFDFYSFHFFARKIGKIQALALGDFTVNLGQGLIHWQSLAFRKSADVMNIKHQSPALRPYNTAGEFNFHRGAGVTLQSGKIEATAFISFRKVSANFSSDTISAEPIVSSFLVAGNHRTTSEIADRNALGQTATGGNVKYKSGNLQIGLNGIYHHYSSFINKRDEPYNLFSIEGNQWYNLSMDFGYTYRNLHLFGEAAADKNFHKAFINGVIMSVDSRVDISFVYRSIDKAYQAVSASAFTENATPGNEKGVYLGITIRPAPAWRFDAYADLFRFPWLRYQVDAPAYGKDYLLQFNFTPNRQVDLYLRYKNETRQVNQPENLSVTNFIIPSKRQNVRFHVNYKVSSAFVVRNRAELVWLHFNEGKQEHGFLSFFDLLFRPMMKRYSAILRLQYFETDGYDSRLYAFENDVLYSYSIPVFFDKGCRYYTTLNYDLTRKLALWLRWGQTIYRGKQSVGSGLDEIRGNRKTEFKVQARWLF